MKSIWEIIFYDINHINIEKVLLNIENIGKNCIRR